MLQPKKSNPNQKTKRLIPKSKVPTSYDVDWDAVRSVNDNVAVQTAKIFDPTGITSYPDVYYAAKDLSEGKGSWEELSLNVLGALPMIGKAKTIFRLAKAAKASKTIKSTKKVAKVVEEVASKLNKVTNPANIKPLIKSKSTISSSKQIGKADVKNIAIDLLDIGNVSADATSVVKAGVKATEQSFPIDKNKVIKYYNTDPKRGEVEKPGQLANVQYVPVSNSVELKKWKEQKLANGTGKEGIDPNKRKLFDESSMTSQGFADVGFNTSSKNFGLSGGVGFNPENLYGRIGGSFNKKGFNASGEFTQRPEGNYGVNTNAGYGNKNINASLGYSKTNDNESIMGNVSAGSDKLKLIMDYLKNAEGDSLSTNLLFQNEIMGASGKPAGTLNSSIGAGVNPEDAFISGGLDYATNAFQQGKGFNYNAGINYSDASGPNINAGVKYRFANGTNQEGIMKTRMNPRKKYANGTSNVGSNYIVSPAEALNDYNIQMAKVEAKAMSNPWIPIVAAVGGAAQSFISKGINANIKKPGSSDDIDASTAGDFVETAMGNNNVQNNVEVEGGEMYETPQGQVGEFEGPAHEQGGIPLEVGEDVQEGTKVYSDRLKVGNKTLAERKATRERQTANLEKIASQALVDQAVKNAAKRKMMAIEKEEMADLDFQEKVNNMQAMADTMVAAFGTGMAGLQDNPIGDSMRYGYGSGSEGVMKYGNGGIIDPTTERAFDSWYYASALDGSLNKKYPNYKEGDFTINNPALRKDFQTFLFKDKAGTKDANNNYTIDGDFGKTTNALAKDYANLSKHFREVETPNNYDMYPGWLLDKEKAKRGELEYPPVMGAGTEMSLEPGTENAGLDWKTMTGVPDIVTSGKEGLIGGAIEGDTEAAFDAAEDAAFYTRGQVGTPKAKKQSKTGKFMGSIPGVGDLTKMFGNYLGMTAGIKTAGEQRASDVTKTNVYKNAGQESQRLLDNAKQGIEVNKAQAIVRATSTSRGGKKGGRNSARGVNQMRGMDWLYDTALNTATSDIIAKAAEQMSAIDIQKSGVAMNADQLKGQGEWQATMANDADKDAYYTALGLGRKDFATGLQQTGADLNDMKQNKVVNNLLSQYGQWFKANADGTISGKKVASTDTKSKKTQVHNGIKYEEDANGNLIKVTG
jgi:hypothetical protein